MLLYQTITRMEVAKKVVKFVDGSFMPALDGASERFNQISKSLAREGVDLTVVHAYRGWSDLSLIAQQGFRTFAVPSHYYYKDHSVVERIIEQIKPDVVEMNDMELAMSAGLNLSNKYRLPLVYDAQCVSSVLATSLGLSPDVIAADKAQEQLLGKVVSGAICFTDLDRSQFVETTGISPERAHVIPLGSDIEGIKPREIGEKDKTVVFLGNMFYEPNAEGVEFAGDKVIPAVIAKHPDAKFRFVGDAPDEMKAKYENEHTQFTGRIVDINEVFDGARVCIAPIKTGGGMRVKILTYMATGVPVVATSIGSEGINDFSALNIADNAEQFIGGVNDLLSDLRGSRALGEKARALVEADYSWRSIARRCISLYDQAIKNPVLDTGIAASVMTKEPFWLAETIDKGRFTSKPVDPEIINVVGFGRIAQRTIGSFLGR